MINTNKMTTPDKMITIRRRITDKLCKDQNFLAVVAGVAIEEGVIKHSDLLSAGETKKLLRLTN